ncbi:ribosomal protection-like ABC-F family protein [Camelliibacillus cellulosilyticus]|uniref:Ribosomal protection-like ABC-F family protein n=1 Tax=Camelliibacillus cellulosilyticus TaxID=2174486 RepID=A0ABV9GQX9_9BACL
MIICAVNQVKKNIGGQQIFESMSLEVRDGERVALVGPNGCGKTTLLKMVAGTEPPEAGAIHIKKGARVGFLEQIPKAVADETVMDMMQGAFQQLHDIETEMRKLEQQMAEVTDGNQLDQIYTRYSQLQQSFEENGGYEVDAKIDQVVNGLGLRALASQPFRSLSGGEQTKVSLGLILLREPELLLLDEPTNHLDLVALEWLEDWLSRYKGAILITSHDRHFLDRVATKIYDLDDEKAAPYFGNYSHFVKEKEERLLQAFAQYQEQQKKIKKMKATIKRLKEWANQASPPNAGLHRQAKSMEKALERMVKIDRPKLEADKMQLQFQANQRSGTDLIKMEEVTFGYSVDEPILQNINFHLRRGERAAIIGINGAGKSTILKLIIGDYEPLSGTIAHGSELKWGYLSQQLFLDGGDRTVLDMFRDAVPVTVEKARHLLAKFLFYGSSVFKKVKDLSGGERMRLRLAQFMHQDVNLLILDEPTNHLDIVSREALEDAIEQYNGTILAVSHDRWFLNQCFPITYVLDRKTLHRYPGPYDYAKAKHAEVMNRTAGSAVK